MNVCVHTFKEEQLIIALSLWQSNLLQPHTVIYLQVFFYIKEPPIYQVLYANTDGNHALIATSSL